MVPDHDKEELSSTNLTFIANLDLGQREKKSYKSAGNLYNCWAHDGYDRAGGNEEVQVTLPTLPNVLYVLYWGINLYL